MNLAVTTVLALLGATAQVTPVPLPSPSPSVSPAATASASAPASAAPSVSPAIPATPNPHAAAATSPPEAYKYRFVPRQPDHPAADVPQIFAVYLNDEQLKSQGPISIKVTTSPNVVKVVSRNGGREGIIPLVVPGDFEANSKLPKVPFIASGMTVDLQIIATGTTGHKTTVTVPVKLQ